mmetsp:Transcript_38183/g.43320  ORF Transcript_38183/g.43320 Transcript_38183/m.43320 type:complete len:165 (-) Transcript_38183:26-520(-)
MKLINQKVKEIRKMKLASLICFFLVLVCANSTQYWIRTNKQNGEHNFIFLFQSGNFKTYSSGYVTWNSTRYEITEASKGVVCIKSVSSGKYLRADSDGSTVNTQTSCGSYEKWKVNFKNNGGIYFKSNQFGKYLKAKGDGQTLTQSSSMCTDCKFWITPIPGTF